ncbi:MAG: hypothetical protein DMD65_02650 [Gemmatimonadetes bacterium]|nr:MAG: hypothetical protein DMD65_02650 [Gemmatimonadota bacterium]
MRASLRLAGLLLAGWAPAAVAQNAAPLRKTDLIRLLANPLIQRSEIADAVRRNCLAFRPSERDWSDLRSLGADADVLGSVGACAARGASAAQPATAPPGAPPPPPAVSLVAAFLTQRVTAVAGAGATVPVQLKRADGTPARVVTLALRATPRLAAGPPGEVKAVTDDSGFAAFDLPAGRQPGRYRLELIGGSGAPLPGRPVVDLVVSPGPPATADVQPATFELGAGDTTLVVALRDSVGNAVPHEPIELRPGASMGAPPPDTQATDSLGRVSFLVRRAQLRRPGQLEVRVRGTTLATVAAVLAPSRPLLDAGFVSGAVQRGLPRTRLADALTFQVRTPSGAPLPGKPVTFQAVNAELDKDSALTDSSGQVAVEVRLGMKAGHAFVTALVDSLRRQDTLEVEPGVAFELVLEREDQRVDGGRILVDFGVPFSLTLRARDRYGNATPTATLTARLGELRETYNSRSERLLDLIAIQPQGTAIVLTFKPIRLGSTDLMIDVGLTTSVSMEVIRKTD